MKSFLDLFEYETINEESFDNFSTFNNILYEGHKYEYAWFDASKSEVLIFEDDNFDYPVFKFKVYGLRKI